MSPRRRLWPAEDVARAQAAAIVAERAAYLSAEAGYPLHPWQTAAMAGWFYDTPGEVNA